ncbi:hypothetical protein B0H16DRAFT_1706287 [Mycena metata]|uniref:Uncharacterized protein n=1 Tax=Mycena metata TaxID=1033252 RepID=A0AAD7DQ68_9AGAR|nr:hypothetical protein B0H16DRAFT_1706287 [Mycena metata]
MDWSAGLEELGRNSAQGKKNNEQTKQQVRAGRRRTRVRGITASRERWTQVQLYGFGTGTGIELGQMRMWRRHGVKVKRERQAKYSIIYLGTGRGRQRRCGWALGREGSRGFVGKAKEGGGRFVLQPDADVGRREEGEWASTRRVGREACARGREGRRKAFRKVKDGGGGACALSRTRGHGGRGDIHHRGGDRDVEGVSAHCVSVGLWGHSTGSLSAPAQKIQGRKEAVWRQDGCDRINIGSWSGLDAGRRSVIIITAAWQTRRNWATHEITSQAGGLHGTVRRASTSPQSGQSCRVEDGREGRALVSTRSDQSPATSACSKSSKGIGDGSCSYGLEDSDDIMMSNHHHRPRAYRARESHLQSQDYVLREVPGCCTGGAGACGPCLGAALANQDNAQFLSRVNLPFVSTTTGTVDPLRLPVLASWTRASSLKHVLVKIRKCVFPFLIVLPLIPRRIITTSFPGRFSLYSFGPLPSTFHPSLLILPPLSRPFFAFRSPPLRGQSSHTQQRNGLPRKPQAPPAARGQHVLISNHHMHFVLYVG